MSRTTDVLLAGSAIFQRVLAVAALAAAVSCFCLLEGCTVYRGGSGPDTLDGRRATSVRMEATGYDSGQKSCNWTYDRQGRPVVASGPDKGKPKAVGITASGTRAQRGTIAADTDYYPFGTVMYVPGYGYGTVEDRGGDITGPHRIDLWFATEREALQWGRKKNLPVKVWRKR